VAGEENREKKNSYTSRNRHEIIAKLVNEMFVGFEDLPIIIQNEIINYVERNPTEGTELAKLVQLRADMYITETMKTTSSESTSRYMDTSTSLDNSQTSTVAGWNLDHGLGHFTVLGAKMQTTMVLLGWILCILTTITILLLYHHRYTIWVRKKNKYICYGM
jgi:hypothetical protein